MTSHRFFVCASHRNDEGAFLRHKIFSTPIKEGVSPLSLITSTKENMRKQGFKKESISYSHPIIKPSVRKTILYWISPVFFFLVALKKYVFRNGGYNDSAFSSLYFIVTGLKGLKKKIIIYFSHPIHSYLLNPPYSFENNTKHNTKHNTFFVMFSSMVVVN